MAMVVAMAALAGCGDGDSTTPIEVSFGDRDGNGLRDGHLTPERAARMSDDDLLVVSIGDSVASGEGNPDREASSVLGRPVWTSRRCHRSLWSGHAEAAAALERADDETGVGFVPLGCSGATIRKGLLGDYRGIQPRLFEGREPAQVPRVNALAATREIDALLVSVGANDVGFSKVVTFCLRFPRCWERPFDPDAFPVFAPGARDSDEPDGRRRTLEEVVERRLAALPADYAALDAALSDEIPRERVVVVEYFDPTTGPGPRGPRHCNWAPGRDAAGEGAEGVVTPAESAWARRAVLRPLNSAIRAAADRHGWTVVDGVGRAFAGHGICAGSDRWVRDLPESLVVQGLNHHGTLHPNRAGHRATGALIAPVVSTVAQDENNERRGARPPSADR